MAVEARNECRDTGVVDWVSREYGHRCRQKDAIISSSFVAWNGEDDNRKGRFVINLSRQLKQWRNFQK